MCEVWSHASDDTVCVHYRSNQFQKPDLIPEQTSSPTISYNTASRELEIYTIPILSFILNFGKINDNEFRLSSERDGTKPGLWTHGLDHGPKIDSILGM